MRKTKVAVTMILCCTALICGIVACGKKGKEKDTDAKAQKATSTPEATTTVAPEATATAAPTPEPTATTAPTPSPKPTEAPEPTQPPVHEPAKIEAASIPKEYTQHNEKAESTVKKIAYKTKAYADNGEEITKYAHVILPAGYDESKKYNVLYLMHGVQGNENEWGIHGKFSATKCALDNMVFHGDIEPFIVVVPNGRSCVAFSNTSMQNMGAFYFFGQELRNDLIPYIDANFSTYAEYDENGYDLTAARDHRAMAGLSMGGMQTINIGLGECLDIISYFGAFSAAPTSNTASAVVENLKKFEGYDINYFYNICAVDDGIAFGSAKAVVDGLDAMTDRLTEGENFVWQTVPSGGHSHKIWNLGFYNFAQIVFK